MVDLTLCYMKRTKVEPWKQREVESANQEKKKCVMGISDHTKIYV